MTLCQKQLPGLASQLQKKKQKKNTKRNIHKVHGVPNYFDAFLFSFLLCLPMGRRVDLRVESEEAEQAAEFSQPVILPACSEQLLSMFATNEGPRIIVTHLHCPTLGFRKFCQLSSHFGQQSSLSRSPWLSPRQLIKSRRTERQGQLGSLEKKNLD